MKKLIYILLMLCLAFGMTSCSKVKSLFGKKEANAPEKTVKTVDLGEVDEAEAEAKDKDKPERPDNKKPKAKRDAPPKDNAEKP